MNDSNEALRTSCTFHHLQRCALISVTKTYYAKLKYKRYLEQKLMLLQNY